MSVIIQKIKLICTWDLNYFLSIFLYIIFTVTSFTLLAMDKYFTIILRIGIDLHHFALSVCLSSCYAPTRLAKENDTPHELLKSFLIYSISIQCL